MTIESAARITGDGTADALGQHNSRVRWRRRAPRGSPRRSKRFEVTSNDASRVCREASRAQPAAAARNHDTLRETERSRSEFPREAAPSAASSRISCIREPRKWTQEHARESSARISHNSSPRTESAGGVNELLRHRHRRCTGVQAAPEVGSPRALGPRRGDGSFCCHSRRRLPSLTFFRPWLAISVCSGTRERTPGTSASGTRRAAGGRRRRARRCSPARASSLPR